MGQDEITISPGTRLKAALALAILADLVQVVVFPLFIEGAASPANDLLDLGVAGLLSLLLGWHWEFLPSFIGELLPGIDFVPFWTLAVANIYRKSKRFEKEPEGKVIEGEPVRKSGQDK